MDSEVRSHKCPALISFFEQYFLPTWVSGRYGIRAWTLINPLSQALKPIRTNNWAELWNRYLKEVAFEKGHVSLAEVADRLYNTLRAAVTRIEMWQADVAKFAPKPVVIPPTVTPAPLFVDTSSATAITITLDPNHARSIPTPNTNTIAPGTNLVVESVHPEQPAPFAVVGTYLHDLMAAMGLEPIENAGMGLCQPMGLADTLEQRNGADFVLRNTLIHGLQTNQDLRNHILNDPSIHMTAEQLDTFIDTYQYDLDWGNDVTLIAFVWLYERDVLILNADPNYHPLFFTVENVLGRPSGLPPITLGYNGVHYVGTRISQTAVVNLQLDALAQVAYNRDHHRVETIHQVPFIETGKIYASRAIVAPIHDRVSAYLISTESRGKRQKQNHSPPQTRKYHKSQEAFNNKIHLSNTDLKCALETIRSKHLAQLGLGMDGGGGVVGGGGGSGGGAAGGALAGSRSGGGGDGGGGGGSAGTGGGHVSSTTEGGSLEMEDSLNYLVNSDDDEFQPFPTLHTTAASQHTSQRHSNPQPTTKRASTNKLLAIQNGGPHRSTNQQPPASDQPAAAPSALMGMVFCIWLLTLLIPNTQTTTMPTNKAILMLPSVQCVSMDARTVRYVL